MDYEKKYKKALEKAKRLYEEGTITESLCHIFPELKENKGEEIRENIISYLHNEKKVKRYISDIEFDKWIAWLEKQCPVNKIKPKFHKGEWVVLIATGSAYQVEKIENYKYTLRHICGGSVCLSNEKHIREWTIQDAKDGDLIYVSTEEKGIQAIFHEYKNGTIFFHCYLCSDFVQGGYMPIGSVELAYPLQKNHYKRFFEKMHETGYTFDFEKKELKKLTQQEVTKISDQVKDSAWNEEDEKMLNDAIVAVYAAAHYTYNDRQKIENWLFSLKQRIGG